MAATTENPTKKRGIDEVDGGLTESPDASTKKFIATPDNKNEGWISELIGSNRDFVMVFYFRAFDRYPGGNADLYLIKYILTVYKDNILFEKYNRVNYDGENFKSKYLFKVELEKEKLNKYIDNVVNAFIEIKRGNADKNEIDWNMIDPRMDHEEEDTKWQTMEFSLYLSPKKKGDYKSQSTVFLEKYCKYDLGEAIYRIIDNILGDSWDYGECWKYFMGIWIDTIYRDKPYGNLPKNEKPITDLGNKIINCCKELCGITSVIEHANGISRSSKQDDKNEESIKIKYDVNTDPYYICEWQSEAIGDYIVP